MSRKVFIIENLREITEQPNDKTFYHGTYAGVPFEEFSPHAEGTGVVSNRGKRYGGFFFTDSLENAEWYGEFWVAEVKLRNLELDPYDTKHPPNAMKHAAADGKNYLVPDVVDGSVHSDVAVIPMSNLDDIQIVNWHFVGEEYKEDWFEFLDERYFAPHEEDGEISKDDIEETLAMMEINYKDLLKYPQFKEYYLSKY